ncbi:SARP family transcriptional regulator [Streptomyces longispororuber]|uniref:SARP family transcriptional regulator n=1 Tax=Streptomyces longispororuber TaxID=68230 RepID=A0A918ZWC4_9ACTN|nr:BTAD domain-containing putative transcriptional regulator [Streptomyces longispororuber]GHE71496.1 SARP family transcriptional regulator [Streptomyces longispororuber]
MRFGILGPLDVRAPDGAPADPGGPRPRALLTLLLLDAGRAVPVERLTDGLYGARPPKGAANALQSQVSRLRKRLGVRIEGTPAGYRLVAAPEDVDAHLFERLAREGREALAAGSPERAAALLREALGLWRGTALADLPDAPAPRARLEGLRLAAVQDRIDADLAAGGGPGLVPELRELLAAHPLSERLYGQLMRALHADGRAAEALAVFEEARGTLARELGADPSAGLSALHLELLRGAEPVRRPAVPVPLTPLVGRAAELDRIRELLAGSRLVTLTGPGGAGKTRLAVEAAREVAGAGGVCFVELAPLAGGSRVADAVLGALGVRDGFHARGGDATERLLAALEGRELLLVLDNCEHVVDDAARTTALLLGVHPGVRVLATSREALGITGEALCPVPPLAAAPAVRLFGERAGAVRPDFADRAADPARAALVGSVCAALDGLPLAIELAAARLRTLTLEELAARLDDRFRLLSRGDRTKAPRHRTLHAVVEWSWDLLDGEERELARRLTVFPGGATPAAVEAVCGVPYPEDLLASLAEKSFVEAVGGRYRMLETIRAFCARRLADAGEEDALRAAHAAYFLRYAEEGAPRLHGAGQVVWLERLAADHANLEAALRHLVRTDPRAGLRLNAALSWYWRLRGRAGQRAPSAAGLLAAVGDRAPDGLAEEYALCLLNTVAGDGDDPAEPERLARAEDLIASLEGPLRLPFLIVLQSLAGGPRREPEGRVRAQLDGHPWGRALLDLGRGFQEQLAGRPDASEAAFARALAAFRGTGDRWGMANCLDPLAMYADWRGERRRALALLDEGLAHVRELAAPEETGDLLCRRAAVLLRGGALEEAAEHYRLSGELARASGVRDKVATTLRGLGDVARLRGEYPRARECYEEALERCAANWFSVAETARILIGLGRTALAASRADEAAEWFTQARDLAVGPVGGGAVLVPGTGTGTRTGIGASTGVGTSTRTSIGPSTNTTPGFGEQAEVAEALAAVAARPEEAARLLGAAAGLRGTLIADDPDVVPLVRAVRARLSPEAYERAFARGRGERAAALRA